MLCLKARLSSITRINLLDVGLISIRHFVVGAQFCVEVLNVGVDRLTYKYIDTYMFTSKIACFLFREAEKGHRET
jgi:hypothetical protein